MKNRWYLLLAIGLTFLLATSVIGCASSYTQTDLDAAREAGYNAGFTEGFNVGLAQSGADIVSPPLTPPEPTPKIETPTTPEAGLPAGAISWDKAKDHIGDRATVCGPVAGTLYGATSNGRPTWLNIGKDYPSSERFVVIIWGENRSNFPQSPESYYAGETVCITGLIQEYQGIPQIEVTTPDQIQQH